MDYGDRIDPLIIFRLDEMLSCGEVDIQVPVLVLAKDTWDPSQVDGFKLLAQTGTIYSGIASKKALEAMNIDPLVIYVEFSGTAISD